MHSDAHPLLRGKGVENLVVEGNEAAQQIAGGIELK